MNKHYHQLTLEQRYQTWSLRDSGRSQSVIAGIIGVNRSTVSREFKRNKTGANYRPEEAEKLSRARKRSAHKARKRNELLDGVSS